MDDTQIIDLYWDRDQGAITATAGKYGSFLHALSWNILSGPLSEHGRPLNG